MIDKVFYKQVIESQAKQIDVLVGIIAEYKEKCTSLEEDIDKLLYEIHSLKKPKDSKSSDTKDLADTLTYILKFLSDND